MEHIIAFFSIKILKAGDPLSLFIVFRITVGSQNNTDCRIVLKLKIHLIQSAIDAGIHDVYYIIFHARKNDLRLRITKAGIVLQYLRAVLCQHQAYK